MGTKTAFLNVKPCAQFLSYSSKFAFTVRQQQQKAYQNPCIPYLVVSFLSFSLMKSKIIFITSSRWLKLI